jgi:hypothetical protein
VWNFDSVCILRNEHMLSSFNFLCLYLHLQTLLELFYWHLCRSNFFVGYLLLCSILIYNTQLSTNSKIKKFPDVYLCHLIYSVLKKISLVKSSLMKYSNTNHSFLNYYTIENNKRYSEEMHLTHKCKHENHNVEMAELQQLMKSCVKFSIMNLTYRCICTLLCASFCFYNKY